MAPKWGIKLYLMFWAALPVLGMLIACAIVLSRASDLFMFICYAISCTVFLIGTFAIYGLGYFVYKSVALSLGPKGSARIMIDPIDLDCALSKFTPAMEP
jgi:hypothetical protein